MLFNKDARIECAAQCNGVRIIETGIFRTMYAIAVPIVDKVELRGEGRMVNMVGDAVGVGSR